MRDGIFHVQFNAPGSAGEGIVVIKGDTVNGGDFGYTYSGRMTSDGDKTSGQLEVRRHRQQAHSIFGPLQNFKLDLSGTSNEDSFSVTGNVHGQPGLQIRIAGRYVAPAS